MCILMKRTTKYQKLENATDEETSFIEISSSTDQSSDSGDEHASSKAVKLKRNVGVSAGVSIVVGSMIGSGIFIVPTGVLRHCNGDMAISLAIWVVGGLIAILLALCTCELATLIPESGGMASYLKKIYGDCACFIFMWLFMLTGTPQGAAVQIIALGDYISEAISVGLDICIEEYGALLSKLIGFVITLTVLACNMTNVNLAVKLQLWCTIGKVIALIVIAVVGMVCLAMDTSIFEANFRYSELHDTTSVAEISNTNLTSSVQHTLLASLHSAPGIPGLSLAVFQALWAYDGFDNITCITEEVKNPKKTLPMIILASVLFVILLYLVVNISYFTVLSEAEMLASDAVAVSFAAKVHPWLAYVVTLGVCLSLIGSINVTFLTAGRMPYVAARMGFMPEVLSMINIKYFSPTPALLFITSLAAIMLLPSNIDMLLKAVVFTLWAVRGSCAIGILILRRKMKDSHRPYKVYKITAVVAGLTCLYIVIVPLVFQPQIFYILSIVLAVLFAGIYWLIKKQYFTLTGVGSVSVLLQKLLLVVYVDNVATKSK